ncbi:MAG: hypothetical protein P8Z30_20635 [Acidobacteriota bacterium]
MARAILAAIEVPRLTLWAKFCRPSGPDGDPAPALVAALEYNAANAITRRTADLKTAGPLYSPASPVRSDIRRVVLALTLCGFRCMIAAKGGSHVKTT